jgi:methionyl-tRNA formyltransferase
MKEIVCFISRSHGLNVLSSLIESKNYRILHVYTHKLNPKSQDPTRSIRIDYELFSKICNENKIPLSDIDSSKTEIIECPECDFIVEVSWRYLIPKKITRRARLLAFGIHRGKLPDYAGGSPIKKAILNNEKEIILSAHYLDSIIDGGNVIAEIPHQINYNSTNELETYIQKTLDDITPLFSKLMFKVFNIIEIN